MKKLTLMILGLVAGVCFSGSAYSQNLVVNGDLELWDDNQNPTDWDKAENIQQATATIHGGTYSAKHISASSTKDFQQKVEGIVAGTNYNISYYFYDNDPMARTRIYAYWTSGDQTLDDHTDILRPSDYSEDADQWILWENTLTAPIGADGFRFEVRVYKQDSQNGGAVYYDDFSIVPASVNPEPSNYPSDFTATASGLNIDLAWIDAVGEDLPAGYLIMANAVTNKWDVPVDGIPVEDDLDLSDGVGAVNVTYGQQEFTFNGLNGATTYAFAIYPYANGGENIDYKTDGTAPEASAETASAIVITYVDFNDETWADWTTLNIIGQELWEISPIYGLENTPCAKMSGYSGSAMENEDWLISPVMNLDMYTNEVLTFYTAKNYEGPAMEVLYSTDYPGDGADPNEYTWNTIEATLSGGGFEWTASGDIDFSAIEGETVTIAFKYTSTTSAAATWEVDNVLLLGEYEVSVNNFEKLNMSVYPNPANNAFAIKTDVSGTMQIVSLTGEVVMETKISDNDMINVETLNAGLYIIKFTSSKDNRSTIDKVIIK